MTYDPISDSLLVANEKEPSMIATISLATHRVEDVVITTFSQDLSGLAVDEVLKQIWVLSDKDERLYLVSPKNYAVLDFWDLPMENPEGIAVDNSQDPPMLFIVTDPSSPHGKQYVGAFFQFIKPVQGTGLTFFPNGQNHTAPAPECEGCDEVWKAVAAIPEAYIKVPKHESHGTRNALIGSLSALLSLCLCSTILGISCFVLIRRNKHKRLQEKQEVLLSEHDVEKGTEKHSQSPSLSRWGPKQAWQPVNIQTPHEETQL
jgi:hypothetical protein